MKILHINAFDTFGGAARAAMRLHLGLREFGTDSSLLVRVKQSGDPSVIAPATRAARFMSTMRPYVEAGVLLLYPHRQRVHFTASLVPDRVLRNAHSLRPDVMNLHWLGPGFVPIKAIGSANCPVVWTLHDMWAFTGGCHYTGDCYRYEERCGACRALNSRGERDLSRVVWGRKRRHWAPDRITAVAPSRWMAERARRSSLLRNFRIEVIPNGLDLSVFRPVPRVTARELLRLPADRKLVLFSAMGGASDPNKGFDLLVAALAAMRQAGTADDVELVVAGSAAVPNADTVAVPLHCVGRFTDDLTCVLLNSAVDVLVAPSRQENLSCTVMEALACGTPAVAFDVGGMPDLIDNRVNGMLVPAFDTNALGAAIAWTLEDSGRRNALSLAAREKAERAYGLSAQARQYTTLYEELLRSRRPRTS